MNLQRARVVLRPRGLAELFDLSLRFCTIVGGALYLRLCACALVPAGLAVAAAYAWSDGDWRTTWLVAAGLHVLVRGVFTVAASRLMFEERPRARAVLGQFARRLPALLVALTAYALLLGVSVIALVGPLFVAAAYTFLDEAILLEQQGALKSLGRARALLRRRLGVGVTLRLGQLLAAALFLLTLEELGQGVTGFVLQLGSPLGALEDGGSAFAVAGFLLSAPYLATVQFLTYIDGRTRQDGWDIQLRFLGLASASEVRP